MLGVSDHVECYSLRMSDPVSVSESAADSANLGPFSLDDLRIFLAVARSGSFRSAAAQLFISQPTLSRAVARLEAQLGVTLLRRGARGVELTDSGNVLVDGARSVLNAAAALRRDVATPASETLTIGATATSARSILAPYLARWIPEHPDVHITAIEDSDEQLQIRLENGDCDAAIIWAHDSPRLETLKVQTVQVMAMMPPTHRLATTPKPISVLDLAPEPLLLNGAGFPSTNLTLGAMETGGLHAEVVFQCSVGQTLAAMAEAGLGIAVFGDTTNMKGFSEIHQRPVTDANGSPLTFDLYIAWKKGVASALVKDFGVGLATSSRR
jgi:DNA-binding transcriptional LysR family regulator